MMCSFACGIVHDMPVCSLKKFVEQDFKHYEVNLHICLRQRLLINL
jgi:hypothetical protein